MQHKHLLLIYHYQNNIWAATEGYRGRLYGFCMQPGISPPLRTRKETNKIVTNINKQWIKQLKIYRPNKIAYLYPNMITTDYTPFTHFVNKIRRFFKLHEKY